MSEVLDQFESLLENTDPIDYQGGEPTPEQDPVQEPAQQVSTPEPDVEPNPQEGNQEQNQEDVETPDYSGNPLYQFLQDRGIKDPSKIKITNEEDNTTEELDFNALSAEEQLEILQQVTDPGLSEDEVNTINFLRQNKVNFNQAVQYYAQQMLDNYLKQHPEQVHQKSYEVDDYTDDDLFLIDLKDRYPDLTDEELIAELESAKTNKELFAKKAESLRNTFKEKADQEEALKEQMEAQQVEDLRNNLMNAAANFNEVQLDYTDDKSDSLMIDDQDKQQMMSYILDQDSEGKSQLVRDLEDPDRLIEIAWFSTQGAKILSELTQYWKGLLADERAENKKLQAKLDKMSGSRATVVSQAEPAAVSGKSVWDHSGLI